jgi:hypothetical protein
MTHDELLAKIDSLTYMLMENEVPSGYKALRSVVELHKPIFHPDIKGIERCFSMCDVAGQYVNYPCPTIQAIEKELA